MRRSLNNVRLLAIDPFYRGFGFVVLEGSVKLIEWDIKVVGPNSIDKNLWCYKQTARLIDLYQPDVLVLENTRGKGSRRCLRVQVLIRSLVELAIQKNVKIQLFSRFQVREAFAHSEAFTKHQIALEIAQRFPEVAPRLPKTRKPWQPEKARMNIFDAAALALTFFWFENKEK